LGCAPDSRRIKESTETAIGISVLGGLRQPITSYGSHIRKGWFMRPGFRALALPSLALGMFLFAGCGATNEEELKGKSEALGQQPDKPQMKSYAEAAKYMTEQQAAKNAAAKNAQKKPK